MRLIATGLHAMAMPVVSYSLILFVSSILMVSIGGGNESGPPGQGENLKNTLTLNQHLPNHITVHVRQPEIPSSKMVGQLLVVYS